MTVKDVAAAVKEVRVLERRNLHRKVCINACFDVTLFLASLQSVAKILDVRKPLPRACTARIATLAFAGILLRMLDGPASIIAMHDLSSSWVPALRVAFTSPAGITKGCKALSVALDNVRFRCAPVSRVAKWLVGGLRLNAQHTGYRVVRAGVDAQWQSIDACGRAAAQILVAPLDAFLEAYDAFCETGGDVFEDHFGGYNQQKCGRCLLSFRISFGGAPPDADLAVATAWFERIKRMTDCPWRWMQSHNLTDVAAALSFCKAYKRASGKEMFLHDLVCCGCEAQAISEQPLRVRNFLKSCEALPPQLGTGAALLAQFKIHLPKTLKGAAGACWGVREACAVALCRGGHVEDARNMRPISRCLDKETYREMYKGAAPVCYWDHRMSHASCAKARRKEKH